jgi:hypothetical protein
MLDRLSKFGLTLGSAAIVATGALDFAPAPAAAQSTGTINTILGAAAVIGGIILYNNYQHKKQAASTVVGYTQNGGTVYGDGRIVMPNGQTVYPNANGQYPWGQYAYYSPEANPNGYTYDYNRSGRYDRTGRHEHGDRRYRRHDEGNGNAYGRGHEGNDNGYGHRDEGNGNGERRHDENNGR